MNERYDYRMALRAKGILPLPSYSELRSAPAGGHVIENPALAKANREGLRKTARGGADDG